MAFEEFDYEVVHKKDTYNTDALSRVKIETESTYPGVDKELDKLIKDTMKEEEEQIKELSLEVDKELDELLDYIVKEEQRVKEPKIARKEVHLEAKKAPARSSGHTIRSNQTDERRGVIKVRRTSGTSYDLPPRKNESQRN